MKFIKPMLMAICLLYSTFSFSAPNTLVTGKITYLSQWTTGLLIQVDTNNNSNPAACSKTGFYNLNMAVDPTPNNNGDTYIMLNDNYKFMRSILLIAKLDEQRVQLAISGAGCLSDRPKIVAVRLL